MSSRENIFKVILIAIMFIAFANASWAQDMDRKKKALYKKFSEIESKNINTGLKENYVGACMYHSKVSLTASDLQVIRVKNKSDYYNVSVKLKGYTGKQWIICGAELAYDNCNAEWKTDNCNTTVSAVVDVTTNVIKVGDVTLIKCPCDWYGSETQIKNLIKGFDGHGLELEKIE